MATTTRSRRRRRSTAGVARPTSSEKCECPDRGEEDAARTVCCPVPCEEAACEPALCSRCPRSINVVHGKPEDRALMTGLHTVEDVACSGCHAPVGWYYVRAYEPTEFYKVRMFVLEKQWLARSDVWDVPRSG